MTGFLQTQFSVYSGVAISVLFTTHILKDIRVTQFRRAFKLLTLISAYSCQNNGAYPSISFNREHVWKWLCLRIINNYTLIVENNSI